MNYINELSGSLKKKLDEKNVVTDLMDKIEIKTKVKKVYQIYGIVSLVALYLMIGYGATFLANLIGFVYPAYYSIKAIQSTNKDDDTVWLTYWVVYAFFSLVECFTDILLFWIPLYALMKCIFLIFLMLPGRFNGSTMLYNNLILPFIKKYENDIDQSLDQAGQFADKLKTKAVEKGLENWTKND